MSRNISDLYGSVSNTGSAIYLQTLATAFGLPRQNVQYWNPGIEVTSSEVVRVFDAGGTGGIPYYAPLASPGNPVAQGSSPIGDANWAIYSPVSTSNVTNRYQRHISGQNNDNVNFLAPIGASLLAQNNEVYLDGVRQYPYIDYIVIYDAVEDVKYVRFIETVENGVIVDIFSSIISTEGDFVYAEPLWSNFTGDGVTFQYEIAANNISVNGIDITLDGVRQAPTRDFTFSNGVVTFNAPPENGTIIDIRSYSPFVVEGTIPPLPANPTLHTFTGTGSQNTFSITGSPVADIGSIFVDINGVSQIPGTDFAYNSGNLVFTTPPPNNSVISVRILSSLTYDHSTSQITATGSLTPRSLGDRFSDITNVLDYGAVRDGIVDDVNAFISAGAGPVFVPKGTYYIDPGTDFSSNLYFSFGTVTILGNTTLTIKDLLL